MKALAIEKIVRAFFLDRDRSSLLRGYALYYLLFSYFLEEICDHDSAQGKP